MKGKISLKDFILDIKKELEEAQTKNLEEAFFELKEVNIEVSFVIDSSIKGSGKFIVVDAEGTAKSTKTHKVSIKLDPIKTRLVPVVTPQTNKEEKTNVEFQGKTYKIDDLKPIGPVISNEDPLKPSKIL